jgi:hypothetical protein
VLVAFACIAVFVVIGSEPSPTGRALLLLFYLVEVYEY